MNEKKRENEYRVCIVGSGIIRSKGISAPYKGTLFESDLIRVFSENRSVNLFKYDEEKDEYISGHLFSSADFISSGRSIEKMIENAGYKHNYDRRCIFRVETLGEIKTDEEEVSKLASEEAERKAKEEEVSKLAAEEAERKAKEEEVSKLAAEETEKKAKEEEASKLAAEETEKKQQHNGKNSNKNQQK